MLTPDNAPYYVIFGSNYDDNGELLLARTLEAARVHVSDQDYTFATIYIPGQAGLVPILTYCGACDDDDWGFEDVYGKVKLELIE